MAKTLIEYHKVDNYVMKVRLYPNKEQRAKLDGFFLALEKAAEETLSAINAHDPMVVTERNGEIMPDWGKMAKRDGWVAVLGERIPGLNNLPSNSVSSPSGGLIHQNLKKAWGKQGKLPVDRWFGEMAPDGKPLAPGYGGDKRISSMFMTVGSAFFKSEEGRVYVDLPKAGKMRIRGWNEKIRFGANAALSWFEHMKGSRKQMGCVISKNGLDEYYISIRMPEAYRPFRFHKQKADVSINVGVGKTLLSSYTEESGLKPYSDKVFKNPVEDTLRLYAGQMSRRYGPANKAFRDDCKRIAEKSEGLSGEGITALPLPEPSSRYLKAQRKLEKLTTKATRKRDIALHTISSNEVSRAFFIGVRSLNTRELMKGVKRTQNLADAAIYQQWFMLSYKAAWKGVPIGEAGDIEGNRCPACDGVVDKNWKAFWLCPHCAASFQPYEAYAKATLIKAKHNHENGMTPGKKHPSKRRNTGVSP